MTRKHFEAIARSIKAEKEAYTNARVVGAVRRLAEALADDFKMVNRNFDRDRFLLACGFTPRKGTMV